MEKVKIVYSFHGCIYPLDKGGQYYSVSENPCVCPIFLHHQLSVLFYSKIKLIYIWLDKHNAIKQHVKFTWASQGP